MVKRKADSYPNGSSATVGFEATLRDTLLPMLRGGELSVAALNSKTLALA